MNKYILTPILFEVSFGVDQSFILLLALIYPHWLTGRKTPTYLLSLCCLWTDQGSHSSSFSRRVLIVTLRLAEAARVTGTPEPFMTWSADLRESCSSQTIRPSVTLIPITKSRAAINNAYPLTWVAKRTMLTRSSELPKGHCLPAHASC